LGIYLRNTNFTTETLLYKPLVLQKIRPLPLLKIKRLIRRHLRIQVFQNPSIGERKMPSLQLKIKDVVEVVGHLEPLVV